MFAGPSEFWDGAIKFDQVTIPFRFELSGSGDGIQGSFFNGDIPVISTSGHLDGSALTLNFDHLGAKLQAKIEGDSIKGTFGGKRAGIHEVELHPHRESAEPAAQAPEIGGV